MQVICFNNNHVELTEKSYPTAGKNQAVIQVLMSGICRTDMELFDGYYHFTGVPGHEFVGRVVEAVDATSLVGRRVVADINVGCGACSYCRTGRPKHCLKRLVIGIKDWDGAFADYVRVPLCNIHEVDESIDDVSAVFTEPLAAALDISRQVHLKPDMKAVVLGGGKLGCLIALALRHYLPHLLLLGRHAKGLDIAAAQGVTTALISNDESLVERLGRFDLVVDATGRPQGVNVALDLTAPQGVLVIKTTSHLSSTLNLSRVAVEEIRMIGSRCGDFDQALSFLKHRLLDVARFVEAVYSFAEFGVAFEHARRPGALKVLLRHAL
jgi:threonine dehydrogenase-like Zn-dependent dehydrogenase